MGEKCVIFILELGAAYTLAGHAPEFEQGMTAWRGKLVAASRRWLDPILIRRTQRSSAGHIDRTSLVDRIDVKALNHLTESCITVITLSLLIRTEESIMIPHTCYRSMFRTQNPPQNVSLSSWTSLVDLLPRNVLFPHRTRHTNQLLHRVPLQMLPRLCVRLPVKRYDEQLLVVRVDGTNDRQIHSMPPFSELLSETGAARYRSLALGVLQRLERCI